VVAWPSENVLVKSTKLLHNYLNSTEMGDHLQIYQPLKPT